MTNLWLSVQLYNDSGGTGPLEYFDELDPSSPIIEDMLEKWWCIGDTRNRLAVWVQGKRRFSCKGSSQTYETI